MWKYTVIHWSYYVELEPSVWGPACRQGALFSCRHVTLVLFSDRAHIMLIKASSHTFTDKFDTVYTLGLKLDRCQNFARIRGKHPFSSLCSMFYRFLLDQASNRTCPSHTCYRYLPYHCPAASWHQPGSTARFLHQGNIMGVAVKNSKFRPLTSGWPPAPWPFSWPWSSTQLPR